jgi:hypothetical protein
MLGSMLDPMVFLTAIVVTACAGLGGVFLLCRHTRPREEKPAKKMIMSDFK